MIRNVTIENFRSLERMDLPLGRVTVLIGENGGGKTNILEAIGLGAAAAADKLDKEFLALRGIRITSPQLMRAGFTKEALTKDIEITVSSDDGRQTTYAISHDNTEYGKWENRFVKAEPTNSGAQFTIRIPNSRLGDVADAEKLERLTDISKRIFDELAELLINRAKANNRQLNVELAGLEVKKAEPSELPPDVQGLDTFLIYAPQVSALRALEQESLIEPLGIYGEGLFKLLQHLQVSGKQEEIRRYLGVIDWFEDVEAIEAPYAPANRSIRIRDHYLSDGISFDQHSANEGFLFVLFYVCLFLSKDTPRFFAIDNVENALNPKLCMQLMELIARLARENDKQVILTTHNPAILDGLDLKDDEQRLFVVSRDIEGHTCARRIEYKEPAPGEQPVRLSEAFLRGYLGGLPTRF